MAPLLATLLLTDARADQLPGEVGAGHFPLRQLWGQVWERGHRALPEMDLDADWLFRAVRKDITLTFPLRHGFISLRAWRKGSRAQIHSSWIRDDARFNVHISEKMRTVSLAKGHVHTSQTRIFAPTLIRGTLRPAGTLIRSTVEHLHGALRRELLITQPGEETLDVRTRAADGSVEYYRLLSTPQGLQEHQLWRSPDGPERTRRVELVEGQLHIATQAQDGKTRNRTLSPRQTAQTLKQLEEKIETKRVMHQGWRDHSWLWRQRAPTLFAQTIKPAGWIALQGQGGKVSELRSGFLSMLGTRYGEVHQRVRSTTNGPKPETRPENHWQVSVDPEPAKARGSTHPPSAAKSTGAAPSLGERWTTLQLRWQYWRRTGELPPIRLIPEFPIPVAVQLGLPGVPIVLNRDYLKLPLAIQLGFLAHETRHRFDRGPMRLLYNANAKRALRAFGSQLQSVVASLMHADAIRPYEDRADRRAGRRLATMHDKDPLMAPEPLASLLERGTHWTPHDEHSPPVCRSARIIKSFHRCRRVIKKGR